MSHIYNIHNIFRIKSDIDLKLDYFRANQDEAKYDLMIRMVKYEDTLIRNCQEIGPGFFYSRRDDGIFSDLNIFGIRAFWGVKNILGEDTELIMTRGYDFISKYIMRFQMQAVNPIGTLLRLVLQTKLLFKRGTFLVGSAAASKDSCIIFSGTHGSGKTETVITLVKKYKWDFISDDHLILLGTTLFSYPTLLRLRRFNLDFFSFSKFVHPSEIFKKETKKSVQADTKIFFLEKGSENYIKRINYEEGISKLCSINNRAIQYGERIFSIMPYVYKELSLLNLQKKQMDVLSAFFIDSEFYILCSSNGTEQMKLLNEVMDL